MIPRNRRIDINSGLPPSASFCSNRVSTTKYNPLTFFPYFLFDQFRRYANLFFLAIGLLQQIPGISPTGKFTTLFPLCLVLLATAVKEIIEDVVRMSL
ncbi:Phospholipid-transporting ATPase tat-1 [Geodia barretti]|uniref:Phospholipid-transporting ATPase tat-1 n=1 Tax=Geodia barretti TaxID=519541 RepID=A0AA35TNF9_GEOBA|nr:Phospholipid-transporting ATPase tat-1 [Geodia barretti]